MTISDRAQGKLREAAARWVARRHGGGEGTRPPSPASEQRAFEDWLADPSHRAAFDEAERLWLGLGTLDAATAPQLDAARAYGQKIRRRRRMFRRAGMGFAAALVAGAALAPDFEPLRRADILRTATGERRTLWLGDGSTIELNTDSEVTIEVSWFGRKARLARGEALFTIAHSALRPFEVEAGGGRIRDIGTQFDVRLEGERVSVFVVEGEVSIVAAQGERAQSVRSGFRRSYGRGEQITPAEALDSEAAAAWADGQLVLSARPLGEVLTELRRYSGAAVKVAPPDLNAMTLSGVVPIDDIGAALEAIAGALSLRLVRQGPASYVLTVADPQLSPR